MNEEYQMMTSQRLPKKKKDEQHTEGGLVSKLWVHGKMVGAHPLQTQHLIYRCSLVREIKLLDLSLYFLSAIVKTSLRFLGYLKCLFLFFLCMCFSVCFIAMVLIKWYFLCQFSRSYLYFLQRIKCLFIGIFVLVYFCLLFIIF